MASLVWLMHCHYHRHTLSHTCEPAVTTVSTDAKMQKAQNAILVGAAATWREDTNKTQQRQKDALIMTT